VLQPYALIDLRTFIEQNLLQSKMTYDPYIFPYTLQYVGKIKYLYELRNLFLWGQGPFIALTALIGFVFTIKWLRSMPQNKKFEILLLLIFTSSYFLTVGRFAVGWMRYLLPIYPLLAVFSGVFIFLFIKRIEKTTNNLMRPFIFISMALGLVLWPLSFMSIYQNPHPRIEATEWINKNIPKGSIIATEHWDDRLPLKNSGHYNFVELTLYDQPDDKIKWEVLSSKIAQAEYLILASNRLYVPLQKLKDCGKYKVCYPMTAEYYRRLFSGNLGFKKIAEFSSYPTIPFINYKIIDSNADESFTVYDHPKVIIFRNNRL